jgi:hypothetical protein
LPEGGQSTECGFVAAAATAGNCNDGELEPGDFCFEVAAVNCGLGTQAWDPNVATFEPGNPQRLAVALHRETQEPEIAVWDTDLVAIEGPPMNTANLFDGHLIQDILVFDLGGDDWLDIIAAHAGSGLAIVNGLADGAFVEGTYVDFGYPLQYLATGDLNDDQIVDLVAVSRIAVGAGLVNLVEADAMGNLSPGPEFEIVEDPHGVALADLDNDGFDDVVLSGRTAVWSALSDGNGAIGDWTPSPLETCKSICPSSLTLADFDSDGFVDILSVMDSTIEFAAGDGSGSFTTMHTQLADEPLGSVGAIGDLDGDSHQDLVLGASAILVLAGDGTGCFSYSAVVPVIPTGKEWMTDTAVADFNADGATDIITLSVPTVDNPVNPLFVVLAQP